MNTIEVNQYDSCNEASHAAAFEVLNKLEEHSDKRILFLVSGGSSASVVASVASRLTINTTNSVTLALVDERYVPIGDDNSNWGVLKKNGVDPNLFYRATEVLDEGTTLEDTAFSYSRKLGTFLDESDYVFSLIGISADGSIAGIQPDSEEGFDRFMGQDLAVGYKATDYDRITITPRALLQCNEVVVYACGDEKSDAISKLNHDLPFYESPAQILRRVENTKVYYGKDV